MTQRLKFSSEFKAWADKEEMVHIIRDLEVLQKGIRLAVHDGKGENLSPTPLKMHIIHRLRY